MRKISGWALLSVGVIMFLLNFLAGPGDGAWLAFVIRLGISGLVIFLGWKLAHPDKKVKANV